MKASKAPCAKCGRTNSTGRDCRDTDACKNRVTKAAPAAAKAVPAAAVKSGAKAPRLVKKGGRK
jgi:hypothetical protein